MRIAILGAGQVGRTLGVRLAARGHRVCFGVRRPGRERRGAPLPPGEVHRPAAAAIGAELLILALPFRAAREVLAELGDLGGRVLVDVTNPIDLGGPERLLVGHDDSGGEQVARWAFGARVVKAFHQTGASNMADPVYGGRPIPTFIAGDDEDARRVVADLAAEIGFEPVDAGPLANARLLEPLAMLRIWLASRGGLGPGFAFQIVRRGDLATAG